MSYFSTMITAKLLLILFMTCCLHTELALVGQCEIAMFNAIIRLLLSRLCCVTQLCNMALYAFKVVLVVSLCAVCCL